MLQPLFFVDFATIASLIPERNWFGPERLPHEALGRRIVDRNGATIRVIDVRHSRTRVWFDFPVRDVPLGIALFGLKKAIRVPICPQAVIFARTSSAKCCNEYQGADERSPRCMGTR